MSMQSLKDDCSLLPKVMASDTDKAMTPDEDVSVDTQSPEDVGLRLEILSDKMTLCDRVLNDLKDLRDVLVKKSLQDVSLPLQK